MSKNVLLKQITKYPFVAVIFKKIFMAIFFIPGFFCYSEPVIYFLSLAGFLFSILSIFWPYSRAHEPSKYINVNFLKEEPNPKSTTFSFFHMSIEYDKRKRIERLSHLSWQILKSSLPIQEKIEAIIQRLGDEDFCIFSVGKHTTKYIQYISKEGSIILDIPILKTQTEKIIQMKKFIEKHHLYQSVTFKGIQLNPNPFFIKQSWRNKHKQAFTIYQFHCRKRHDLAALLGLDILKSIHEWNESPQLTVEVKTNHTGWWHNL
jgi:hypothetical protein